MDVIYLLTIKYDWDKPHGWLANSAYRTYEKAYEEVRRTLGVDLDGVRIGDGAIREYQREGLDIVYSIAQMVLQ